ncbi:MAG: SCO family protein [Spirochaetota bacterium]
MAKKVLRILFPMCLATLAIIGIFFKTPLINHTFNRGYYGILMNKAAEDFPVYNTKGKHSLLSQLETPTYLYFGYTTCKTICPSSMGMMYRLAKKLGNKASFVFVSLDWQRDSFAKVQNYTQAFGRGFYFYQPEKQELFSLARSYGISYQTVGEEDNDFEINHTNYLFLVDKRNRVKVLYMARHNKISRMLDDFYHSFPEVNPI